MQNLHHLMAWRRSAFNEVNDSAHRVKNCTFWNYSEHYKELRVMSFFMKQIDVLQIWYYIRIVDQICCTYNLRIPFYFCLHCQLAFYHQDVNFDLSVCSLYWISFFEFSYPLIVITKYYICTSIVFFGQVCGWPFSIKRKAWMGTHTRTMAFCKKKKR